MRCGRSATRGRCTWSMRTVSRPCMTSGLISNVERDEQIQVEVLQVDLVLPRWPIPGIGGASVRDHYVDPAGPAIDPLIKMANIVAIMIISLIAIHGRRGPRRILARWPS